MRVHGTYSIITNGNIIYATLNGSFNSEGARGFYNELSKQHIKSFFSEEEATSWIKGYNM